MGTGKAICPPVTVYSKKLSSQCNLTAQIEAVHDKMNGTDTLNLLFRRQILSYLCHWKSVINYGSELCVA